MPRSFRQIALFLLLVLVCGAAHAAAGPYPTAQLTVADPASVSSGSFTVEFNGFVETVTFGPASTAASLASAMGAMFTRDFHRFGLYAKADANATDPNVVTFQLVNGNDFTALATLNSSPFGLTGSGFAGAAPPGTPDEGTVTLTLTGPSGTQTVSQTTYGEGSTSQSIAQGLAVGACSDPATRAACVNLIKVTAQTAPGTPGGSPVSSVYLLAGPGVGPDTYTYNLSFSSTYSFNASNATGTLSSSSTTTTIAPVYAYIIPEDGTGYDAAGNLLSVNDTVMGSWSYGYDPLNRLVTGSASGWGPYSGQSTCWSYDSFGNRLSQSVSTTACSSSPTPTFAATYDTANRISQVTSSPGVSIQYDGGTPTAGNVTNDGTTQYTYDAEGRVCALLGPQGMVGYQYDADGTRIGKGSVTNWQSCDITSNGYQPMTDFVLDQGGAQMTEVAVSYSPSGSTFNWTHTNVMADGMLVATYDTTGTGLHFYLNDALGTRRAQTDPGGFPEQTCQSLPYGDQLYCTGSLTSPTEHHFTGKERDAESGLDYFGARYYSSNMGRFMSPDWAAKIVPVPYAKLDNPQSLNLYGYVVSNPLSKADPDGHCVEDFCIVEGAIAATAFAESPTGQRLEQEAEQEAPAILQAASQFGGRLLAKAGNVLEEAVQKFTGLEKNREIIMKDEANGAAFRKPDLLNMARNLLGEVKDAAKVNLSKQLSDYFKFAEKENLKVNLFTREGTKFSRPLIEALQKNGGKIFQQVEGKWVDNTKKIVDSLSKK